MILYTIDHSYKYECEKICRLYFPAEKIFFACEVQQDAEESKTVYTKITDMGERNEYYCKAHIDGRTEEYSFFSEKAGNDSDSQKERLLAKAIVKVLSKITGIVPPWGILTGIRPAKLMRKYIDSVGKEEAMKIFSSFFEVSEEKVLLAAEISEYEEASVRMTGKDSFSLYVSIPFCPSRCSYCSFVSHSVDKAGKLIPDYVEKLCRELEYIAVLAKDLSLKLETVYIGGGTPTSFTAEDLQKIIFSIKNSFSTEFVKEFTVEAGRPDTIDEEKLTMLKNEGVTRISINPQTFSDEVLRIIGRRHSAEDTTQKFLLARRLGFGNINMDLIAGLPGDTFEGFKESIKKAVELSPENITVHTLSMKRSSDMVTGNDTRAVCLETEKMLTFAGEILRENGYYPYYMYRQSKTVGNLENVGWCKKDKPCLYNIYMMDEIHTVLAAGAGSVTKLVRFGEDSLERIYNFKYPYEYISEFETMLARKNEIRSFYSGQISE